MARRNRLHSLQQLADFQEAESARRVAERQKSLSGEEQRLQQIAGYLEDYLQQTGRHRGLTSVAAIQSGRHFLERLRGAVNQQHAVVETHRHQVEQQTVAWKAARVRAKALHKLAERRAEAEFERSERREQVRLDEVAGKQFQPGKS
jgi:flagellar export protein FliJ